MSKPTTISSLAGPSRNHSVGTVSYYQVDHSSRVSTEGILRRRRNLVRWIFGTSELASTGLLRGSACRGEEHEIVLFWEEASSHYELWVDGLPQNVDTIRRDDTDHKGLICTAYQFDIPKNEQSYNYSGTHNVKILVAQPKTSFFRRNQDAFPDQLEVDGHRFSDNMIKIYQLGMTDLEIVHEGSTAVWNRNVTFGGNERPAGMREPGFLATSCTKATRIAQGLLDFGTMLMYWERQEEETPAASTGHCTRYYNPLVEQQEQRMIEFAKRLSLQDTNPPLWKRIERKHVVWLPLVFWLLCKVVALVATGIRDNRAIQLVQYLYASLLFFLAVQYVQARFIAERTQTKSVYDS